MTIVRAVGGVHSGMPTSDGAGVELTRMVGIPDLDCVDPFLMLDQIDSDDPNTYIAGFPDHPHRGFETVTIMLEGLMRHRDSVGNDGVLKPGDVQWMTAGRGIIHSEVPEILDGRLRGFQLWVNLPASKKMMSPNYQDISRDRIPLARFNGGEARIITGNYLGQNGPAVPQTPIRLMDVRLKAGTEWIVDLEGANDLFICVYEGTIIFAEHGSEVREVFPPATVVFEGNGALRCEAGKDGAKILYCEGEPIGEPVAKYGPFVMNTHGELLQAVSDYNAGTFVTP